jgi:hypothetical protein
LYTCYQGSVHPVPKTIFIIPLCRKNPDEVVSTQTKKKSGKEKDSVSLVSSDNTNNGDDESDDFKDV